MKANPTFKFQRLPRRGPVIRALKRRGVEDRFPRDDQGRARRRGQGHEDRGDRGRFRGAAGVGQTGGDEVIR